MADLRDVLRELADRFRGLEVLVVGDAILDVYERGTTRRLCPEAPVPVIEVAETETSAGGAANVAVNLARLGATTRLLAVVGDDAAGARLRNAVRRAGAEVSGLVAEARRETLAKRRVVAAGQIVVRCDTGGTGPAAAETEAALLRRLEGAWARCAAVIVSDYGYGTLTAVLVRRLAELQREAPRVVTVDAKDLSRYRDLHPAAVKPNLGQALSLLGLEDTGAEPLPDDAAALFDLTGARVVAVTLGGEGAVVLERGRVAYRTRAAKHPEAHASGAGDAYLSALTLGLAAGADTPAAAELAAAAAAVAVRKRGTAWCSAQELREAFAGREKLVAGAEELRRICEGHRSRGERVVFTNGCFDLLHRGHVVYLERARRLGDVLVVGVNDDEGIARLKGAMRPINRLEDRLVVLSALGCVDHVVPFAEDTPAALLRAARPDVFVKGGDYTKEMLPEAAVVEESGGIVEIVPLEPERSTTRLIDLARGPGSPVAGSA